MDHEEQPAGPDEPDPEQRPDQPEPNAAEQREAAEESPQIWVGSLLDYNNGVLYGTWLAANREADDIHADITTMLAGSPTAAATGEPAEEWGIFDYEGFGSLRIGEYESIAYVSLVARGIAEHGLAFAAWAEVMEDEDALGNFSDAYVGHHASVEDYVQTWLEETGYQHALDDALPAEIGRYAEFNLAALAHDLEFSGDLHILPAEGGGVWLFRGDI